MAERTKVSSGAKWEDIVGYSRAVRTGNIIEIAGTTAVSESEVLYSGNFYMQTKVTLQKIESALKQCGASLSDVVRTRIYVTDISKWEEVGRAHGEFFSKIKPASTMVEVSNLINPEIVVEIEATALLNEAG